VGARSKIVSEIAEHRESQKLPGVRIDDKVTATRDLAQAADADANVGRSAQAVRAVANDLRQLLRENTPVIVCAKGSSGGRENS